MNEILELRDDLRAYPTAYCRDVEAFASLIDRDESEHCQQAVKELAYVYHFADPTSPYADQQKDLRREMLGRDLFDDEDFEPDDQIEAAIGKYRELKMTESMQLLESARTSVHSLREYFEEADFTERDDNDKLVWKPKDMVRNLEKLGNVVESLKTLKNEVEKEQHSDSDNRGGVETNKYSR